MYEGGPVNDLRCGCDLDDIIRDIVLFQDRCYDIVITGQLFQEKDFRAKIGAKSITVFEKKNDTSKKLASLISRHFQEA